MRRNLYLTAILFFFIDILTKILVLSYGDVVFKTEIIPNFFSLHLTYNSGAAFSILQGYKIALVLIGIFIIIFVDKYFIKDKMTKLGFVSIAMLVGGTFGNLLDRILDGYITDFLEFNIFGYNFPIFNFADIFITVGALLLIISVIKGDKNEVSSRK